MHRIDEVSLSHFTLSHNCTDTSLSDPSLHASLPAMRHKHTDLHGLHKKRHVLDFRKGCLALFNSGTLLACIPQHIFFANYFQYPISPQKHPRICSPVTRRGAFSWNMSLMITFGNKWQDMLTTVADSIYPHEMLRLTFWDQFQSHVN